MNPVTTTAAPAAGTRATVAPPALRPLVIFFVLAFSLPWAASLIAIAQHRGLVGGSLPLEPFLVLGSWTPNIAAFLVLAFVLRRRGGVRALLLGWTRWKAGAGWYLVALSPLLIGLVTIGIVRGILGQPPAAGDAAGPGMFATVLLLALVTGATGEELGWRGFALPYLQTRMNALGASIVLGALWGLWHLPLWFTGFGWEQQSFWLFTLNCISFSIVATWVCNSTDARLVIVTLMHLFYNFGSFVSTDAVLIPAAQALPYWSALLGVFAMAVVAINGPATLSRRRPAPVDAGTGSWRRPVHRSPRMSPARASG